jgi:alpha-tubulin suppressor-like RCC1 family protein
MAISSSSCGVWKLNDVYNKIRVNYWNQESAQNSYFGRINYTGKNACGASGDSTVSDKCIFTPMLGDCWICATTTNRVLSGALAYAGSSFGIRSDGTLWSWGHNDFGQLGQNNITNSSSPIQIPGTQWSKINAFNSQVFAIKNDGTLWSWGENSCGTLGQNNRTNLSSPVQIPGTNWCRVAASRAESGSRCPFTFAFKNDGTAWVWGVNTAGVLGLNDANSYSSPVQIPGTQWVDADGVSFPNNAVVFLRKADGTLWASGQVCNLGAGRVGFAQVSSPVQIPGTQWTDVCVGFQYTNTPTIGAAVIAKSSDGNLYGWGCNDVSFPILGFGFTCAFTSPVVIPGSPYARYTMGLEGSSLAIKPDGTMWAWGNNLCGQLGLGTVTTTTCPTMTGCNRYWVEVNTFAGGTIARERVNSLNTTNDPNYCRGTSKTDVYVWGKNDTYGPLGLNNKLATPSPVCLAGNWTSNFIIGPFSIARKCDNTLWAWGQNDFGQMGLNNQTHQSSPTQIPGTAWCCVSSADWTIAAIKSDNTLWAWGNGQYGNLGQNSTIDRSSPIQIPGTSWCSVNLTIESIAAVKTDGTLWMWGRNSPNGGLGQNDLTRTFESSPVQIPGTQWCFAASAGQRSYALKTDNTLWAWGKNTTGELGQNDTVHRSSPVQIPGTQWCRVAVSDDGNILALKSDNTLWSWGCNFLGKLGLNDIICRSSPTQIPGTQWIRISATDWNGTALKTDGTLWTWGGDRFGYGSLGLGVLNQCISSPVQIPGTNWFDLSDQVCCAGAAFKIKLPL